MQTLNGVKLGKPNEEVHIDDLMSMLKNIARSEMADQDFIFITGIYRIEFHKSSKMFVVEQRIFDHEKLNPEDETVS